MSGFNEAIMYQQVGSMIVEAIAKKVDADMWWLTLEEHWRTFIKKEVVSIIIEEMKPRWMPSSLWQWLHTN